VNRALAILSAGLVCSLAACGDSNQDDVSVTLFQAAPATIEAGQSTQLLFAIDPPEATVTIDGLGDQTGKTQISVTPGQTTTYRLTASMGRSSTTADAKVTVNKKPVTITLFQAAPDAIESGQSTKLVFAVDPADAKLDIAGIGDVTGKSQVAVSPPMTTTFKLTATKNGVTASSNATVSVGPQTATAIKVEASTATPLAGVPVTVTVTAIAGNGMATPGFRGTVRLTSSDGLAVLPADLVFVAADAGVKQVAVTLRTAGPATLTGTDAGNAARQGTVAVTVNAAAATTCAVLQAPPSAVAGAALGVSVVFRDPFGNQATGFAGTVALTATDLRAVLPPPVTYVPLIDAGSHAFSASLVSTGLHTLTASDTSDPAIQCTAIITVDPAAPRIVLAMPGDANAGYPLAVGLAVRDVFDNPIPAFTGTVSFTSTDTGAGATPPAPITFTGSEGGVATTSATFVTLGAQALTATGDGTPAATGTAASAVHGLVYTAPTRGRVRLIANPAASNTQVVQLDLIANERLEVASFFGGGPGSFAAGMNLPLDTTRVGADATLFLPGPALTPGTGTRAAAATLGATDHVLYAAVSRKRVATSNFNQQNDVAAGGVFFSVRLKLQPNGTVGPVFDGAQPSPLFRAAVRDQFGDDFVNQGDIAIGKLEVR
jgi:hypothetical protein